MGRGDRDEVSAAARIVRIVPFASIVASFVACGADPGVASSVGDDGGQGTAHDSGSASADATPRVDGSNDASGARDGAAMDAGDSSPMTGDAGAPAGDAATLDGGNPSTLARRPYMGWSSWTSMHGGVTDAKIRAAAGAMSQKLSSFGYAYVNIDSGWQGGFDANGRPQPRATTFPDIQGLAAYVHGLGLKMGIYLTPGLDPSVYMANAPILNTTYHVHDIVSDTTVPGNTLGSGALLIDYTRPGANEYIQSCADVVASWGVDFIKMDFVGPGGGKVAADNRPDIRAWRTALDNTGRPIWLELSNNLAVADASFWKMYANGWRITGDIEAYGTGMLTSWAKASVRFTAAPKWVAYGSPGGWNDLDSLEVGAGAKDGLTADERQTVVTLWAVSAAPLSLGPDLTALDVTDLALITNTEVIAIDQAGVVAVPVSQATSSQVWFAANPDGSRTVALFNLGAAAATVTADFGALGLSGTANVHDVWTHTDLGPSTGTFGAMLPSHGSRLLTIAP
jgi:hypothetical protein